MKRSGGAITRSRVTIVLCRCDAPAAPRGDSAALAMPALSKPRAALPANGRRVSASSCWATAKRRFPGLRGPEGRSC